MPLEVIFSDSDVIVAGLHLLQEDEEIDLKSPKLFRLLDLWNSVAGDVCRTVMWFAHEPVTDCWSSAGQLWESKPVEDVISFLTLFNRIFSIALPPCSSPYSSQLCDR